jgi:UDP-3-O-[3-hydroxymyristoyl] glucosamine N-acyltransferase
MFAGQVGIAGHIKVADGTKAGAQAGIAGDVRQENTTILGSPAIDYKTFLKASVVFKKLPELKSRIDEIEKQIGQMKNC